MFARLRDAIRADFDRQTGWAKDEALRQTRYTALTIALAGAAGLAVLGALVVGVIALYSWLAVQSDPLIALGVIGGGLLLLALILLALALIRRRPRLAARPPLQSTRPAALFGLLAQGPRQRIVSNSEPALKLASDSLRQGSRSALWGTIALVAIVGVITGRRGL